MTYEHRDGGSNRRADILLVVGFFSILLYPTLALFETPEALKAKGKAEQRQLTPRPPIWELASKPGKYVEHFKSFFEDQFEGRNELVTLNSLVRYSAFRTPTSTRVVVGKHGVLFFAGEAYVRPSDIGHELANYRRVLPVTERRLRRIHEMLASRKKWARDMGAEFVFVIAPDKGSIYPEDLPDWVDQPARPSFADELVAYLRDKGDVDFLDLRPALKKAKETQGRVYYARDTHWNHDGARVGLHELEVWLHDRFPSIKIMTDDDYVRKPYRAVGDLASMLHLESYLQEFTKLSELKARRSVSMPFFGDPTPVATWEHPPLAFQTPDPRLPKALIYHDSFFMSVMPSLAENFQASVFIRDRRVYKHTVKDYKPDVVIFECVERNLFPLPFWTDDLNPSLEPELVAEMTDLFQPLVR